MRKAVLELSLEHEFTRPFANPRQVTPYTYAGSPLTWTGEDGLIDEADFRKFGFTHSVQLYAGPNPDFFKGTRIEVEAAAELV